MLTLEEQLAKLPLDDFSRNVKGNVMKASTVFGAALFGAVLVGFIVVISGYGIALNHFGWPLGATPEIKPENWGVFGDFLGGTINPILTFLTFIAVLATLFIQAQELKATRKEMSDNRKIAESHVFHLKSEADKSDIQRTISIIDNSLEDSLLIPIVARNKNFSSLKDALTEMISIQDLELIENPEFNIDQWHHEHNFYLSSDTRDKNIYILEKICGDLEALNKLLLDYNNISKDAPVVEYYIRKYKYISLKMIFLNLSNKENLRIFLQKLRAE